MTRAKFLALLILMGIVMIVFAYFFLMPSHADYDDHIAEDIGGDNFLVVNLNQSLKIKEENILRVFLMLLRVHIIIMMQKIYFSLIIGAIEDI